jgi:FKBP-type peptidyl-prolyl cis-trans isomerase
MKSLLWALLVALSGLLVYVAFFPVGQPANAEVDMSELVIEDIELGAGEPVAAGQRAVVHYTGWLFDDTAADNKGKKFDSSLDRDDPFAFKVGGGQVIRGWDLGVEGMRVGGMRRLVIPASLGYGARGAGGVIPGGATLIFEISLEEIEQ